MSGTKITVAKLRDCLDFEVQDGHGDHLITFGESKDAWQYVGTSMGYSGTDLGPVLELEPSWDDPAVGMVAFGAGIFLVQPTDFSDPAEFWLVHWDDGTVTIFVHPAAVAEAVSLLGLLCAGVSDFTIRNPINARPWRGREEPR